MSGDNSTSSEDSHTTNIQNNEIKKFWLKTKFRFFVSVIVLVISIVIYKFFLVEIEVCNLKNPKNRDFNSYYGLKDLKNPFSVFDAEKNDQTTLFEPIVGENMKYSSMILTGEKGSGKTHIRQYRLNKLNKNETIIIEILGNNIINSYLEIFVNNINDIQENEKKFTEKFSKSDFMHIILSEMVNEIYRMNNNNLITNFDDISFDERVNIAFLLSFYTGKNANNIDLLNRLLKELETNVLDKCEIQLYNNNQKRHEDKAEFLQMKNLYNNVKVMSENHKIQGARLLYCINEKTGIRPDIFNLKNEIQEISVLAKFFRKNLKKMLYITIDSLDENIYFFDEKGFANLKILQSFINSVVNQEFLGLALGNEPSFNILLFLPKIKDINLEWALKDKIPIITLDWNSEMLNNYADFVLYNLKEASKNECKKLPNFKELLQSQYAVSKVLNEARLPRGLHIFMVELIKIMNYNCVERKFIANDLDIDEAIKNFKLQKNN